MLDNLALLIHLDGIDAAIAALIFLRRDGDGERLVNLANAISQHAVESQQDWKLHAAQLQPVDQLLEIDRPSSPAIRMHLELAVLVDGKVAVAPPANFVQLFGVLGSPTLHRVLQHAANP